MVNEFRICDDCQATNLKTLLPKLKKIDPEAFVDIGCQSYCVPGRKKVFVFLNHRPMAAPDEEQLMRKMERTIQR
ncbi:DUF1450 domain-containing protein [Alteribacillus sp. JSM 102045]|uniref:DUF1450 domain-containing protein n=1 Tax=Alteribacillus sp. JSM 102045 TaxID=1562101 RepID=UPI0035BF9783